VVAFGTSIPEVGTSVYSALGGYTGIPYGNVVGSNVANMALVLGAAAFFGTFKMKKDDVSDLHIFLLSAILTILVALDLKITFFEGILLLLIYSIYLGRIINNQKRKIQEKARDIELKTFLLLFASIISIYFGAKFSIDGAVAIARNFGITQSVIGFTLIALSTSLPELATSVIAVFRKNYGISIGNIIGSNIFNSFVVLGLSSFVATLTLYASDLVFQVPAMTILTAFIAFRARSLKFTKIDGLVLLAAYILIMIKLLL